VVTLPAQRWEYDRVEIQQNAKLKVAPGGLSPFDLVVRGNMILRGTIEATNFDTDEITHEGGGPDGNPIRIEFKNDNRGGSGGSGSGINAQMGGAGATGTTSYGGGGGGGAVWWSGRSPPPFARNGISASDERGAEPLPICGRRGGDGGRRAATGNGGFILFRIAGDFDGSGGVIDLRGSAGIPGRNGELGGAPGWDDCQRGGGGGGGGGPGAQGGYLLAGIKGRIIGYPTVMVNGGAGGAGGSPNGRAGEPGRSGAARWFGSTGNGPAMRLVKAQ
jgi:hypothetical protein